MKRIFIIIPVLFAMLNSIAQDINFSQFYELPLLRNPALAGVYIGDFRVTAGFRSQWNSVTTPYKTGALGIERKRSLGENSDDFISYGLQATTDQAGDSKLTKTQLLPMLAYHKSVSRERDSYITLGFLGGYAWQHFDITALKFGDQFVGGAYSATNPTRQTFTKSNVDYWDFSTGISFSSVTRMNTSYYIGASYFHFTQPKVAFNKQNDIRLNKKIVINAGLSSPVTEYNTVVLYGDYFMQGGNSQVQAGLLFRHDIDQVDADLPVSLSVGGFYRWNDALVPVVKLDYYRIGLGLTYDVNMSKLLKASHGGGGFELTLSYRNFLSKKSSAEKMRCPVGVR